MEDLVGKKFTRLTVIEKADPINKRRSWKCICDCGKEKIVKESYLKNNDTKSCGCLNTEKRSLRFKEICLKNVKYEDPKKASARRVYRGYNNEPGDIEFEDFYKLIQMDCHYCKSPPKQKHNMFDESDNFSKYRKENGLLLYNGLDRVDSSKGHSLDNVVPCCKWCNYAKRERSVEEFKIWVKKIGEKTLERKFYRM